MQEFVCEVVIQDDLQFNYKKTIWLLKAIRAAIHFPLL